MRTQISGTETADSGGRCRTTRRTSICASTPSAASAAGTRRRRSRPSRNGLSSRRQTGAGSIRMSSPERHLAEFNIARIKYPLDDPRMKVFVDNVDRINKLADTLPGFVWRLQDESGHAMGMRVCDDPAILPNLTVWQDVEALERFVFKTVHGRFFDRRETWFEQPDPTLVMWWVPAGHQPTLEEGVARLDHLKTHGPSDHAFGWESLPAAQIGNT